MVVREVLRRGLSIALPALRQDQEEQVMTSPAIPSPKGEMLKPCQSECFFVRDKHIIHGDILRCLTCEKRAPFTEAPKRVQ
jgi:hypothetical protein